MHVEKHILVNWQHKNIVKFYQSFKAGQFYYFLLELCENGSLAEFLAKHKTCPYDVTRHFAAQILNGLEYLHSKNFIHRDLKPSNVLITKTYDLKLTDFGTAKIFDCKDPKVLGLITVKDNNQNNEEEKEKEKGTFVGTHEYISPESLNSEIATPMVDIWGLGIMVYEMINGHTPFKGITEMLTYINISEGTIKFKDDTNPVAKDFILKLLHQEPKERLGFNKEKNWIDYSQLRSHEFFKDIDFKNIDPTQIKGLISGKQKKTSRTFAEIYSDKRKKITPKIPKPLKMNSECYSTMDSSTNTKFIIPLNELR